MAHVKNKPSIRALTQRVSRPHGTLGSGTRCTFTRLDQPIYARTRAPSKLALRLADARSSGCRSEATSTGVASTQTAEVGVTRSRSRHRALRGPSHRGHLRGCAIRVRRTRSTACVLRASRKDSVATTRMAGAWPVALRILDRNQFAPFASNPSRDSILASGGSPLAEGHCLAASSGYMR